MCMCVCPQCCWYVVVSPSVCGNISVFNIMRLCSQTFQDGVTALMVASEQGRTDVVELLIKHNVDVNERTKVRLHIHYIDREIGRLLFVDAYKHVCVPLSVRYDIICHTQYCWYVVAGPAET